MAFSMLGGYWDIALYTKCQERQNFGPCEAFYSWGIYEYAQNKKVARWAKFWARGCILKGHKRGFA